MKSIALALVLVLGAQLHAHCLDDQYLVTYGNPDAPHQLTEYFSFSCPHCIALFNRDFSTIRDQYLQGDDLCWTFHPIPVDLLTIQAMICMDHLDPSERQIFLEEILREAAELHPLDLPLYMEKLMELFGKPCPDLHDTCAMERTPAFEAAFRFAKDCIGIDVVPSLLYDNTFYRGHLPSLDVIDALVHSQNLPEIAP